MYRFGHGLLELNPLRHFQTVMTAKLMSEVLAAAVGWSLVLVCKNRLRDQKCESDAGGDCKAIVAENYTSEPVPICGAIFAVEPMDVKVRTEPLGDLLEDGQPRVHICEFHCDICGGRIVLWRSEEHLVCGSDCPTTPPVPTMKSLATLADSVDFVWVWPAE